jgi:hypothetical protein
MRHVHAVALRNLASQGLFEGPSIMWHVQPRTLLLSAGSGAFLILFAVPCELSVLYNCTTEASRLKKRKEGRGVLNKRQSLTCTEYSSAK